MKRAGVVVGIVVAVLAAWWLLDGAPPVLQVEPSWGDGPVAGEVQLGLDASDGWTGLSSVVVELDGEAVELTDGDAHIDGAKLVDGEHRVVAVARDRRGNEARQELTLRTDNSPPLLELGEVRAATGRTTVVWLRSDEPLVSPSVTFLGSQHVLRAVGDGVWRALVGVPAGLDVESAELAVRAQDAAGNPAEAKVSVDVELTAFPRGGMIALTEAQVAARRDTTAVDAASAARRQAYATPLESDLWSGRFDLPVAGVVSSPFGKVRTYSDGRISRHLGTDMAAGKGTPVHAPAAGVVVLSQPMAIYGEVIIVKHGPEVATSYNHLSRRSVAVGDVVARGGVIGEVGSTGQSTGPHLHWGMTVGGVAVAPEQWVEQSFDAPPGTVP